MQRMCCARGCSWLGLGCALALALSACKAKGEQFHIDELRELVADQDPDAVRDILGEPSLVITGTYGADRGARAGDAFTIYCYDQHRIAFEYGEMNLLSIEFVEGEYQGLSGNEDEGVKCREWLKGVEGERS